MIRVGGGDPIGSAAGGRGVNDCRSASTSGAVWILAAVPEHLGVFTFVPRVPIKAQKGTDTSW